MPLMVSPDAPPKFTNQKDRFTVVPLVPIGTTQDPFHAVGTPSNISPSGTTLTASTDETVESARSKGQMVLIMATLCLSTFTAALDITIVTTAAPTISKEFRSVLGYSWIGSAFLLGNAVSTPIWAKLSDIYGCKAALMLATVVFLIGSGLCGGAADMTMLLVGRGIQGIGGGGIIILVLVCISEIVSMRNRGFYLGILGMVWAIAGGVGPILGGIISQRSSWRWCFYLNLPCTGVALGVLFFFLKLKSPKTPLFAGLQVIDHLGCITIVGGTAMFLLGLEFGGVQFPWSSATVICLIIFGIICIALFIVVEWKQARYPIMPLRLFKSRSNIACFICCVSHGALFLGGSYYLPVFFQTVLGVSPLLSGIYFIPFPITLAIGGTITGIFTKRTGRFRECIWVGQLLVTLGFGLYADCNERSSKTKLIFYQIIAGLGVGPLNQSPLIALQRNISQLDTATATATYIFIRILAASISVVLGGVIFQNRMQVQALALRAGLGDDIADLLVRGALGPNLEIVEKLPKAQRVVARTAFANSLRYVWIFYATVGAAGFVASLFIDGGTLLKTHVETEKGLKGERQRVDAAAKNKTARRKKISGA